ncbi:hypothetical protein [Nocardia sp. CA-290969]|uniref:hypothetical protein n=1 Tax=Nocardia sp. CA-290969 TaxID=3239986 RepID=UPI003D922DDE
MATAAQALEDLLEVIELITSSEYSLDRAGLANAVAAAVGVAPPAGLPRVLSGATIAHDGLAREYQQLAKTATYGESNLAYIAAGAVPSAWRGAAGENVVQALESVSGYHLVIANIYFSARQAMETWAEQLAEAQRYDDHGRSDLAQAVTAIAAAQARNSYAANPTSTADLIGGYQERRLAIEGCRLRLRGARLAEQAAADFVHTMTGLSGQTRARALRNAGIDPLAAVVAAYAPRGIEPAAVLVAGISSPTEITHAAQIFATLPTTEQAEFQKLLADSNSPQEAACLWKLLGRGEPVEAIVAANTQLRQIGIDPVDIAGALDNVGEAMLQPEDYRMIAMSPTLTDQLRDLYAKGTTISYADLRPGVLGAYRELSALPGLNDRIQLDSQFENTGGRDSVSILAHEVGHAVDPEILLPDLTPRDWGESPAEYSEKKIQNGLEWEARAEMNRSISSNEIIESGGPGLTGFSENEERIFNLYHQGVISEDETIDRIVDYKWEQDDFYKEEYG